MKHCPKCKSPNEFGGLCDECGNIVSTFYREERERHTDPPDDDEDKDEIEYEGAD